MEDNSQGAAAPVAPVEGAAPAQGTPVDPAAPAVGTPAAKAEAKIEKKLRELKLKVDGKEYTEKFDPEDDEYMTRNLQMAKMGQKRAQELATLQKEARDFITNLRANPRAVLSDPNLGIDMKKIVAEMIEEEIANSKKSPDQIEKEQLQKELKKIKEETEKAKKDSEEREYQRIVQDNIQKYDQQIGDALEKSKLPSNGYTIKKMTDYMMLAVQNGLDIAPSDIAKLVQGDMKEELAALKSHLSDDELEEFLGADAYDRIRKKKLAKSKPAAGTPPVPLKSAVKDTGTVSPKKAAEPKKIAMKDFFKLNR